MRKWLIIVLTFIVITSLLFGCAGTFSSDLGQYVKYTRDTLLPLEQYKKDFAGFINELYKIDVEVNFLRTANEKLLSLQQKAKTNEQIMYIENEYLGLGDMEYLLEYRKLDKPSKEAVRKAELCIIGVTAYYFTLE